MKKTHLSQCLKLCFSFLLLFCLCACSKPAAVEKSGYTVTLPGNSGTGYFWSCSVFDNSIAKLSEESTQGDGAASGAATETSYTFSAVRPGSTRAILTYSRSWDATICYTVVCDLTVDADKVITGELSQKSAVITIDGGEYDMLIEDDTVVRLVDSQAPSVAFQGLRDGSTHVTFTPAKGSSGETRCFLLTVDQSLDINASESEGDEVSSVDELQYHSLDELEAACGFSIPLPESAQEPQYSMLDDMFCITFLWNEAEITYIGGKLDVSQFFGEDSVTERVHGIAVGVTTYEDGSRLAGWEDKTFTGYICSAQSLTDEQLLTLLDELVQ